MITPIQARFDTFTYLEEKYSELLERADKVITDSAENGSFKASMSLDNLSTDDKWQFKKLLEYKGYLARFSYNNNNIIIIEW